MEPGIFGFYDAVIAQYKLYGQVKVGAMDAHNCVPCEVRPSFTYKKSNALPVTDHGGPQIFPVRYDHRLHIKRKAIPITGRGTPCYGWVV
jgi:hypothetical protein